MPETLKRLIAGKIHGQETERVTSGECAHTYVSWEESSVWQPQRESQASSLWSDSNFFISLIFAQDEYILWLSWLLSSLFDKMI